MKALIHLGQLRPDDVTVELYMGRLDAGADFADATGMPMQAVESLEDGRHLFEASGITCCDSGQHGYTVRVVPCYPGMVTPYLPGLITWAESAGA